MRVAVEAAWDKVNQEEALCSRDTLAPPVEKCVNLFAYTNHNHIDGVNKLWRLVNTHKVKVQHIFVNGSKLNIV